MGFCGLRERIEGEVLRVGERDRRMRKKRVSLWVWRKWMAAEMFDREKDKREEGVTLGLEEMDGSRNV